MTINKVNPIQTRKDPDDIDRFIRIGKLLILHGCTGYHLDKAHDEVLLLMEVETELTEAQAVALVMSERPEWSLDGTPKPLTMAVDPESWQWAEVRASRSRRTQRINDALAVGVGALLGLVLIGALYLVTLLF